MKAGIVEERSPSAPLLSPPFIRDNGYQLTRAPEGTRSSRLSLAQGDTS